MGDIALGYGSKWHLLRYLGWHRSILTQKSMGAIPGAEDVQWLDFPFDPRRKPSGDGEWQSLEFLGEKGKATQAAWREAWPHGRGIQTWDAVGRITLKSAEEWLLVEAKAHIGELKSNCKADGGLELIKKTVDATKAALEVPTGRDWLKGYYQYANRVAALYFLSQHQVPARLLFIYFLGDSHSGHECPPDDAGWQKALTAQAEHLGLSKGHILGHRIHHLFLHASPAT